MRSQSRYTIRSQAASAALRYAVQSSCRRAYARCRSAMALRIQRGTHLNRTHASYLDVMAASSWSAAAMTASARSAPLSSKNSRTFSSVHLLSGGATTDDQST